MSGHRCPPLDSIRKGAVELRRLGHSVPPTGAARARLVLAVHGWHVGRGALLDADRLAVLAKAAIGL